MGVSREITATFFDLVYNAKNSMHIYLKKIFFLLFLFSLIEMHHILCIIIVRVRANLD